MDDMAPVSKDTGNVGTRMPTSNTCEILVNGDWHSD